MAGWATFAILKKMQKILLLNLELVVQSERPMYIRFGRSSLHVYTFTYYNYYKHTTIDKQKIS